MKRIFSFALFVFLVISLTSCQKAAAPAETVKDIGKIEAPADTAKSSNAVAEPPKTDMPKELPSDSGESELNNISSVENDLNPEHLGNLDSDLGDVENL